MRDALEETISSKKVTDDSEGGEKLATGEFADETCKDIEKRETIGSLPSVRSAQKAWRCHPPSTGITAPVR